MQWSCDQKVDELTVDGEIFWRWLPITSEPPKAVPQGSHRVPTDFPYWGLYSLLEMRFLRSNIGVRRSFIPWLGWFQHVQPIQKLVKLKQKLVIMVTDMNRSSRRSSCFHLVFSTLKVGGSEAADLSQIFPCLSCLEGGPWRLPSGLWHREHLQLPGGPAAARLGSGWRRVSGGPQVYPCRTATW